MLHKPATHRLKDQQDIDSHTDPMVWIRQVAARSDRKEAEYKDNCCEKKGENLQIGVVSDGGAWSPVVKSCNHDAYRDEEEVGEGCEHAMAKYQGLILR